MFVLSKTVENAHDAGLSRLKNLLQKGKRKPSERSKTEDNTRVELKGIVSKRKEKKRKNKKEGRKIE